MSGDFLPYAKQEVTADDIQAVVNALQSPIITRGQETASLEQDFAQACGADYAVTFNSGSTALEAAYHAGQVGPQDRVLTTPVTFVSSISGALRLGARIVFIDVDPSTALLDEEQLRVNLEITPSRGKTVLVPVHYAGAPHDMERIESWIKEPDCLIIEDAAHALGATYPTGEKVGSCTYSQMTVFSLHPAKHITTGEGGVVTTNDPELYRSLLFYRNNYLDRDPESVG
ncbi:MAG: DegT/DnrJ/EryC1/StrS family aminotransferase, partial [Chlamydiia bacterium]|nr:DegT/DnrJ/EryC1/StrS family aminotransferase [Chlamydiia bacterium]